jgi:MFS transporter, PPP family, 3-phenylpropionic acid transporter
MHGRGCRHISTKATRSRSWEDVEWKPSRLTLFRQRAFARVTLIGALVLGSHAMYDSFAVIRWSEAGISPATIGLLWSESVTAEVLVFLLIGTTFLRVLKPTGALACAASCGVLRWGVMAQTTDVTALALIQPLHGFTFALLHLASCGSSPALDPPLWPEQRRRSTVLLALVAPQLF